MTADAPPEQRELATVLRELAWTIHRLVPETAGLDPLPNTEIAVLRQVLASPGITVNEMARQLTMKQSNTSAAVRNLVQRGLVARERSAEDGRVTRLVPTEKSVADDDRIDTVWSGTIRHAMTRLTAKQMRAIEAAAEALSALDQSLHTDRDAARSRC